MEAYNVYKILVALSESEGDEELSEEGLSWDELEKKAIKSDKEHSKKHKDEEEENKGKKGKKSRK